MSARRERGPASRIVGDAISFRASALLPAGGVRVGAGSVLALVLGSLLITPAVGAAAAGGSLAPGLTSLDVDRGPRLGRAAATCLAMAAATFLGSTTGRQEWQRILVAGLWAATWGFLAAVEPRTQSVAVNAVVALLVFGRFAGTPQYALGLTGAVGAGGALQLLLAGAVALFRLPRTRPERLSLGRGYAALAGYARSIASGGSALASGEAVDAAGQALLGSPADPEQRQTWASLVSEAARVRLELLALAQLRSQAAHQRGQGSLMLGIDRLLITTAEQLDLAARWLSGTASDYIPPSFAQPLEETVAALRAAAGSTETLEDSLFREQLIASAEALAGQLRAIEGLLPVARRPGRALQGVAAQLGILRLRRRDPRGVVKRLVANLSWRSSALRHAVRMAAVVVAAMLIGQLPGLERGYWIGLTAVLVLRPEFGVTFSRGIARAVGTLFGVGIAGAVAVAIPPAGVPLDIALGAFTAAAGSLLYASYAAFSVAITGSVVFLLATVGTSPVSDAEQRLIATSIGAALALTVYALWPTWSGPGALQALAGVVTAERRYIGAVLAVCADPAAPVRAALPGLDRDLRLARTNAEAAVALGANEPARRRTDPDWAEGLLAAQRRLSLATHALRARLEQERSWPPLPDLTPLAAAIDEGLGEAVAAIAADAPPRTDLGLRSLHRRMVAGWDAAAGGRAVPGACNWVAMQTDEMVDALGTLIHVVARRPRRP